MSEIAQINVGIGDSQAAGVSFSLPMLLAPHTQYKDSYRDYGDIAAIALDFPTTHPVYEAARIAFVQEGKLDEGGKKLKNLRIGRQIVDKLKFTIEATGGDVTDVGDAITVRIDSAEVGVFYALNVVGGNEPSSVLAEAGDDETDVAAKLVAEFNAGPDGYYTGAVVSATSSTKTFVISGNHAGQFPVGASFQIAGSSGGANDGTFTVVTATNVLTTTEIVVSQSVTDGATGTITKQGYTATNSGDLLTVTGSVADTMFVISVFRVASVDPSPVLADDPDFSVTSDAFYVRLNSMIFAANSESGSQDTDVAAILVSAINANTAINKVTATDGADGTFTATIDLNDITYLVFAGVCGGMAVTTGSLSRGALTSEGVGLAQTETIAEAIFRISDIDDTWYGVAILDQSDTAQKALSADTEAKYKICSVVTEDDTVLDPADTDNLSTYLTGLTRDRTMLFYHTKGDQFPDLAILANRLPNFPGASTFAHQTLKDVDKLKLLSTPLATAKSRYINVHENVNGVGDVLWGTGAGGRFMDLTWAADYIRADLDSAVTAYVQSKSKIPLTNAGLSSIVDVVLNRINSYLAANIWTTFTSGGKVVPYIVTVIDVADLSEEDKNNRNLPAGWLTVEGRFAGAVHTTTINVFGSI